MKASGSYVRAPSWIFSSSRLLRRLNRLRAVRRPQSFTVAAHTTEVHNIEEFVSGGDYCGPVFTEPRDGASPRSLGANIRAKADSVSVCRVFSRTGSDRRFSRRDAGVAAQECRGARHSFHRSRTRHRRSRGRATHRERERTPGNPYGATGAYAIGNGAACLAQCRNVQQRSRGNWSHVRSTVAGRDAAHRPAGSRYREGPNKRCEDTR